MNLILGLDLETTGLDVNKDHIIEIGAVLYDIDRKQPVSLLSEFILLPEGVTLPPEISALTGIQQEYLQVYGIHINSAMITFMDMVGDAQALVAHNGAAFDLPFLQNAIKHMTNTPNLLDVTPLIDTMTDLPLPPEAGSCRKFRHLCADHGFLHDENAHRAVFDVMDMLRVLAHYDIPAIIERCKSPQITIQANVSYDERQKAKDRGFQWDPQRKAWLKVIRAIDLAQERELADFGILAPRL